MENGCFRLSGLHPLWRLGVGLLVVCLVGGYVVSGVYLHQHYENRDERRGLTITDIQGAYAGVVVPSPMLASLRGGHPDEGLSEGDRAALIEWLSGDRVREDYENFDLGDAMPADLIAMSCLDCHARGATGDDSAADLPLEYPDDVFGMALSRDIRPKEMGLIVQSLHAHAPTMASIAILLSLLAAMTRWGRGFVGAVVAVTAIGLVCDLGAQPMARLQGPGWAWVIVVGGVLSSAGVGVLGLLAVLDLWLPRGKSAG